MIGKKIVIMILRRISHDLIAWQERKKRKAQANLRSIVIAARNLKSISVAYRGLHAQIQIDRKGQRVKQIA